MSLIIAGIEFPFLAGSAIDLKQSSAPFGQRNVRRSRSGTGRMASRWSKVKSTITGSGRLPPGLESISQTTAVSISFIERFSVAGAGPTLTLPHAYRTDDGYEPQAVAIVNGFDVKTTAVMAGQVCTVGAVSGASAYKVVYYPVLTGFVSIKHDDDAGRRDYSWSIEFEQQ